MVVAANVTSLHDARPEVDPAHDMDMTIGDISELEIAGSQVLVGVYLRGERTAGGIIDPTQIAEDKIQGKCVRVLKLGNTAFTGDNPGWNGNPPKVGDWVFHRAQDAAEISVKGRGSVTSAILKNYPQMRGAWPCRLVYAADIYGRVADPNMVV